MEPKRIQRQRTKGWRKPDNTANVTRPGQWGNQFIIGSPNIPNAQVAADAYEHWLKVSPSGKVAARMAKALLKGKNLMCWCKVGDPCHGDVLLKVANE